MFKNFKILLAFPKPFPVRYFNSIDEMNSYVTAANYGSTDQPYLCLGVSVTSNGANNLYEYSIRFNSSGGANYEIYNTISLMDRTIPFVK